MIFADRNRRDLLRYGALAGLGCALPAKLAYAADLDLAPNVKAVIERWVGPGKFPGMIASIGRLGKPTQYIARGSEGFADADPVTPDSLFRIYSMTKPITGMAVMQLIDEGKLGLDQPLYDILPKFSKMQVQNTPDGSISELHPAKAVITIRHLLTHTAGLAYTIIQKGPIKKAYEDAGLTPFQVSRLPVPGFFVGQNAPSLATFADRLADMPLMYEPGTKWNYSVGLDLLGRVIEVVSGKPFDQYLNKHIFEPCGMTSTWFQVPSDQFKRLTTNYGVLSGIFLPIDSGPGSLYLNKPAYPFGGAGLVSSPRDYDRFMHMLTNYGKIDGKRVLSELAVRVGTSNLLPDGVQGPTIVGPQSDFGAGGRVGIGDERGVFGWAGAAGTVGTVDMNRGLRMGMFVQFMPPDSTGLLPEYAKALRSDITLLSGKL